MRRSLLLVIILTTSLFLFMFTGCSSADMSNVSANTTVEEDVKENLSQNKSELDYDAYKQFLTEFIDDSFPEWSSEIKNDFLNRLLSSGISEMSSDEQKCLLENELHIASVRYNSPTNHPEILYKDAFDYFFVVPTWSAFEGSQNNSSTVYQVTQFEGQCTYKDAPAVVLIQFMLDNDGVLKDMFLSVDDIPKSQDELDVLLNKVFEDYSLTLKKASPVN